MSELRVELESSFAGLNLGENNFDKYKHPLVRLYYLGSELIKIPGGRIEYLDDQIDNDCPFKKSVPHATIEGTNLFVRTFMIIDSLQTYPSAMYCGFSTMEDGIETSMYTKIEQNELEIYQNSEPMQFDEYMASYFESHLKALSQHAQS